MAWTRAGRSSRQSGSVASRPGSASVTRMVVRPNSSSATTIGTGRYATAQIMRSDSARSEG